MMQQTMQDERPGTEAWLLLIVSLPSKPSSLRVRAWRKLRALGAIALKNSVYVLPFTADNYEQLQWLGQEIQKDGGDATLVHSARIENMPTADLVRLFQTARDADYRSLAGRYRRLLAGLDRSGRGRRSAQALHELLRLARDAERVREIDFFESPGYREVERLREIAEARARPATVARGPSGTPLSALRGRTWVTRPRPHVDRIASAWLVKRFIDAGAEFVFAPPGQFPPEAVPYDVVGAEFGHQGDHCTFETLLKHAGLGDRRLAQLAEIVHEADLRDGKFQREEASGIDLAVRGLVATLADDRELLRLGMHLFDGLYAAVGARK